MGFKAIYTYPTRQRGMDMVREVATIKTLREQYPPPNPITEDELLEEIADADAIVNVRSIPMNREIIEAAKNLKIIARHGLGYETVDVEAASERNIVVTRATAQGPYPVAEFTIGLLLALSKKYIPAHASVKSGKWESLKFKGSEVRDKTLGIIGLGAIGSTVARIATLGLQMKVIAYDPYVSEEKAREVGAKLVEFHSLLMESDYISVHAAVTKESKGILGKKEFDLMKKGVFVINCARGEMLDDTAFYEALSSGKVAGAALDVLAEEPPLLDNPLLGLENVILTPHAAGITDESLERMSISIAENIVNIAQGRLPDLETVVNKAVLNSPPWNKMDRTGN